ncbi:unnamed protein product [Closterium sp. NIES-53]
MNDARQYGLYADVDYGTDGYVCSRVRILGCLPPVSVDLCLSSLGACVFDLGACVASGNATPPAEASLSFTLEFGASQCFFRDHTTLTPLLAPVPVALADPSSGPAVARSSTTLLCHVVPSGVLRGLHIPSFTRNLVGVGYLQDRGITVTFVGGGRTAVCTDAAISAVLTTFTKESRSGLYVLHIKRSPVPSSIQWCLVRLLRLAPVGPSPTRPSCCTTALATCRSPASAALPVTPSIPTPRTYREAVCEKWASQWKAAMDAELASWRSTGTYVDAAPPPRANVVDGMWLFKVKRPTGSLPVFKARYVARGFSQREGVEFFQTFASTPKMTTLWVLLHVAAQRDYELLALDFSTAFLQGRLHEEIWLRRPPSFTDTFPPGTQWSLRRPVYGLRQSPREWHNTLRSTLRDLGFCPSSADPSLLVRTGSTPFFILVYVDDLVFATVDRAALTQVKSELQKRHKCTDLGELQRYLGLQITRNRATRTITLTQSHIVQ